jgi:hypothetical protein
MAGLPVERETDRQITAASNIPEHAGNGYDIAE